MAKGLITITDRTRYWDSGDGWAVVFELDTCEACGGEIQGPNAVNVPLAQIRRHCAEWLGPLPTEGYHSAGRVECCDNCYEPELDDE